MDAQKQTIKHILETGGKHCSTQFTEVMKIIDYRARISSIRKELETRGFTVHSDPCKGSCGRKHTSPVSVYWIDTLIADCPCYFCRNRKQKPHLEPPIAPQTNSFTFRTTATLNPKYCCGDRIKGKDTHSHDCSVKQEPVKASEQLTAF